MAHETSPLGKVAKMLNLTAVKEIEVQNRDLEHLNFTSLTEELIQETQSNGEKVWREEEFSQLVACL